MPSIFEVLKRLALGQQVFRESDGQPATSYTPNDGNQPPVPQPPQPPAEHDGTPLDASGRKILPVVLVNEVTCHEKGTAMECWGVLKNTSNAPLELKKATILGATHEIEHPLAAGEEREFMLYEGERPHTTAQTRCMVEYKNEGGDYFVAEHFVEYDILSDGTCLVKNIRFIPPVRDI